MIEYVRGDDHKRLRLRTERLPNGCWRWLGDKVKGGYGRIGVGRSKMLAHRWAYELLVGPIPEGMELDHVRALGCIGPSCVNPAHLEPVTPEENHRRTRREACRHGHPYTDANSYVRPDGYRDCRTCINRRSRERNARRQQARRAA